jgi:hypothetical protein
MSERQSLRIGGPLPPGRGVIWWLRPHDILWRFILPIFVLTAWFGMGTMSRFKAAEFIDLEVIAIGSACLLAASLGATGGMKLTARIRSDLVVLNRRRTDAMLIWLGLLVIAAHMLYLGGLLAETGGRIVEAILSEGRGQQIVGPNPNRLPGITTFTQLALIYAAILGAYAHVFGMAPSSAVKRMALLVLALVTARAILGSERLALIEVVSIWAIASIGLMQNRHWPVHYQVAPLAAAVGVFALFASAEYFRSWPFYLEQYDSYLEFASTRFFGYLATATNNGAGSFEMLGASGYPSGTSLWLYKLPIWNLVGLEMQVPTNSMFLTRFANPEFNSPSGVYAPINDFGIVGGLLVWATIGAIAGWLFVLFVRHHPFGLILYPLWLFGFFDVIRFFFWGDSRSFPALLFALPIYLCLRQKLGERASSDSLADLLPIRVGRPVR